jgi:hypothetical protein
MPSRYGDAANDPPITLSETQESVKSVHQFAIPVGFQASQVLKRWANTQP